MADGDPVTPPESGGIEVEELRSIFRSEVKAELDERGITKEVADKLGILDGLEGLFEKHKGEPMNEEGLLGKIGSMIDSKLEGKNVGGGKTERQPRLRVFG